MGLDNPIHIAVLLIVMLLVFGAKRLPEMGRSLGSGMRGFRDSLQGVDPAGELSRGGGPFTEAQDRPTEPVAVASGVDTDSRAA